MKQNKRFAVHIFRPDVKHLPRSVTIPIAYSMDYIRSTARSAMKAEKAVLKGSINIVFVSSKTIKKLNKKYLGKNRETDVICFPYSTRPPFDGDIVISIEASYKQAKYFGHTHRKELRMLVIHGVLHLLGWRDYTVRTKARMLKRQQEILNRL